jgi:hypothetical protein
MACHIYDLVYCKVMMITICNMQSNDTKAQCILWRKLNAVVEKKRSSMPVFKGFMVDVHKKIGMLFTLYMGLEILRSRWFTKSGHVFSIGLRFWT